jgi:hypothetical protein
MGHLDRREWDHLQVAGGRVEIREHAPAVKVRLRVRGQVHDSSYCASHVDAIPMCFKGAAPVLNKAAHRHGDASVQSDGERAMNVVDTSQAVTLLRLKASFSSRSSIRL